MKLFSRKAIAAVATSVALTTAGLSAPAYAAEDPAPVTDTQTSSNVFAGSSTTGEDGTTSESSSKNTDPKEIRDWVGIVTAVVGALTAVFTFVQRLTK